MIRTERSLPALRLKTSGNLAKTTRGKDRSENSFVPQRRHFQGQSSVMRDGTSTCRKMNRRRPRNKVSHRGMAAVEELTVALRRSGLSGGRLVRVRDGSSHTFFVAVRNSDDSTSSSSEECEEHVLDVHPEKEEPEKTQVVDVTVRVPEKGLLPASFRTGLPLTFEPRTGLPLTFEPRTGLPLTFEPTFSGQNIPKPTTQETTFPADTRTMPRETTFVSIIGEQAATVEDIRKTVEPETRCHGRSRRPNSDPVFNLRAADSPTNNKFLYVCQEPAGAFRLKMGYVDPREEGVGLFRRQEQMRESDMKMVYAFTNLKSGLTMGVHSGASGAVVTLMMPPCSPLPESDPRVFVSVPYRSDSFLLQATVGKGE
ncbi:hypothetical protein V1264_021300 [Littorina saxatilis]|uniref:Uncharacterized protein n=1 Tax=Littorina saxatilis TaxID=31220 RepID=A0AAN9AHU9_9CAEN